MKNFGHRHNWFCKIFLHLPSNTHRFNQPFRQLFYTIWFFPIRWISQYNEKNCVNFYPDYMGGLGTKIKPFFGFTVVVPEGERMSLNWWRYLKKYKKV